MTELLEFLETLKCEFENKGIIKSSCFDDVSITIIGIPNKDFDKIVVEGTCYFGKHNNVSTTIFQTICNKKPHLNYV